MVCSLGSSRVMRSDEGVDRGWKSWRYRRLEDGMVKVLGCFGRLFLDCSGL